MNGSPIFMHGVPGPVHCGCELKRLSIDTTLWGHGCCWPTLSAHDPVPVSIHVTVVPRATLRKPGEKTRPMIVTVLGVVWDGDGLRDEAVGFAPPPHAAATRPIATDAATRLIFIASPSRPARKSD